MSFEIQNKIVLRTPSLAFNRWNKDIIYQFLKDPAFLESIYIASPDLYYSLISHNPDKFDKLLVALTKYLLRSMFRPTPFGLFAGCACCEFGGETSIVFDSIQRHTRLDTTFLIELIESLETIEEISGHVKYYPNNSLYQVANSIRFTEHYYSENKRFYNLSAIISQEEIVKILTLSAQGATFTQLVNCLTGDQIQAKEASDFVYSLIDNKVLVSGLTPALTGDDMLAVLLQRLHSLPKTPVTDQIINILANVEEAIKDLDKRGINSIENYWYIIDMLKELKVPLKEKELFQTDLFKFSTKSLLNSKVKESLYQGIEVLIKLAAPAQNQQLDKFKIAFVERFESQQVPLLLAMDPETGIGYPVNKTGEISSLNKDLILQPKKKLTWELDSGRHWFFERHQKALFLNEYSIDLSLEDLSAFKTDYTTLPPSFSVVFRVVDFKANQVLIESAGQTSAVNLLSRFAYGDKQIYKNILDIKEKEHEHNPHIKFADIIHLPESRTGNVLQHPVIHDYEIPYLAHSALNQLNQIPLQDLYICVDRGIIELKSKKLNKVIIPRLSNAHNYSLSELPVYKFLCDLQSQNQQSDLSFTFGEMEEEFIFSPRITYGNTILHLASWNLKKNEWDILLSKEGEALMGAIAEFTKKWKMPRYVSLAQQDQELCIDFEDPVRVTVFVKTLAKLQKLVLKEFLFDANTPIQDQTGGKYVNQFIASVITKENVYKAFPARQDIDPAKDKSRKANRNFPPGSSCLYYKLYAGAKTADSILTELVFPLIKYLLKAKLITKWFFVRYHDTHSHIRVRLFISHSRHYEKVYRYINKKIKGYQKEDRIWKTNISTYKREVERYGKQAISEAESLFFLDSMATLHFLSFVAKGDVGNFPYEDIKWLWSIKGIDALLDDFHYNLSSKIALFESLKNSFASEFNLGEKARIEIDKKYRYFRKNIENMLALGKQPIFEHILQERSQQIRPVVKSLFKKISTCNDLPLEELLKSYIHMSLNRILTDNQRIQEMVIYHFMYSYYRSQLLRK